MSEEVKKDTVQQEPMMQVPASEWAKVMDFMDKSNQRPISDSDVLKKSLNSRVKEHTARIITLNGKVVEEIGEVRTLATNKRSGNTDGLTIELRTIGDKKWELIDYLHFMNNTSIMDGDQNVMEIARPLVNIIEQKFEENADWQNNQTKYIVPTPKDGAEVKSKFSERGNVPLIHKFVTGKAKVKVAEGELAGQEFDLNINVLNK